LEGLRSGAEDYIMSKDNFLVRIYSCINVKIAPLLCADTTTHSARLDDSVSRGTKVGEAVDGLEHPPEVIDVKISS
jgi:D-arabinose 1-dehydrogenase-like Zn-dependent alcohol dehydrogenase